MVIDEGEYEPDVEEEEETKKTELPAPVTIVTDVLPFNNIVEDSQPKKKNKGTGKKWLCKILIAILMCPCRLASIIKKDALMIDKVARVVFPLGFALFNVIYWSIYKSEHDSDIIKH
jgi:hypothetical protein